MAKTAAERKAEQRSRAKRAGLCTTCCINKPKRGKLTCQDCYENRKSRLYQDRKRQK